MPNENFQARLERIGASNTSATELVRPASNIRTINAGMFSWGLVASFGVCWLFNNIQRISDMAPESIRNSDTPGLYGAPVALLSIAWFVVIPIWFVLTARHLISANGKTPSSFALGAFAGMAVGLGAIKLLG